MFFLMSIAALLTTFAAGIVLILSIAIPIIAIGVLRNVAGNMNEIFLTNTFDINDLLAKLGMLVEKSVPSRVTIERFPKIHHQKPITRVVM
mmetsp:Transcript_13519/g.11346  ORF Transcript_13519/g.11346 Transcript_13519/m.11346 type:complete len:91 (-) Transcript_13519:448-720(-)